MREYLHVDPGFVHRLDALFSNLKKRVPHKTTRAPINPRIVLYNIFVIIMFLDGDHSLVI